MFFPFNIDIINTLKLIRFMKGGFIIDYNVIDISKWRYENKDVSGSKEKRWYRSIDSNNLALFKLPISLTSNSGNKSEPTGEPWSEKISSEIGKCLGFSTHDVDIGVLKLDEESTEYYGINTSELGKNDTVYGALCWSFLDEGKESLVEGADMIMDFDSSYDREKLRGDNEIYNFNLLYRIFSKYNITHELFKMIIFDTLIGNTDRHQDNFGLIREEKTGELRFSPFYDNSSSMGREIQEARAIKMLKDERMFKSYILGKKSATLIRWGASMDKKMNIFDFFYKVKNAYPRQINQYLKSINTLSDSQLESIISKVPNFIMSNIKKELVLKILKVRRDILLE
jgi:hypothetical protein